MWAWLILWLLSLTYRFAELSLNVKAFEMVLFVSDTVIGTYS